MKLETLAELPAWEWPEGTDARLLAILTDPSAPPAERTLAAELAGDYTVMNDDIAEALLAVLADADETQELRATCAIALGAVLEGGDMHGFEEGLDMVPISEATFHRINDTLQRLYNDAKVPQEVRRRVLEGAVRAPQDWQRAAIRAAFRSDSDDWRLTAVFCMRWMNGFDAQIMEALRSPNVEIRYEAVTAAGERELDAAWDHIVALLALHTTPRPLLLAAIEAVATIRPEQAREVLLALTSSPDKEISEAVESALRTASTILGMDEEDEDDDWQ